MDKLSKIAGKHSEWVSIVKSFGERNYADDIVQDVYLRIHKYNYLDRIVIEDKINTSLMWAMLRNATHDHNKKYKRELLPIDDLKNYAAELPEDDQFSSLERLHRKIRNEILNWHWYDTMLFTLYLERDLSMREIAKQANISLTSIFNTLKNCKQRLKDNVGEDWRDYLNKDFELIK